ncbi:MAG: EI24 domain-containing protein [Myxococcales bacterium]|nr:EI24 domain-containing protein [Myxococcales bacterium]
MTSSEPNGHASDSRISRAATGGGIGAGVRLLFEGVGMLLRERSLWTLAAVPVTFCALALITAGSLIYFNASTLAEALTGWLPELEVEAWYQWLWLGPAKLLLGFTEYLLFAAFCGISLLLSLLLANLASAPFLDVLSQRVEEMVAGTVSDPGDRGFAAVAAGAGRTIRSEFQRLVFFAAVWGVISLAGVLIPGAQLIAPPALLLFTVIFLPLDYAGYLFDRRQISFIARRNWLSDNLPIMLGFGSTAMGTALVPGLNLLLLPSLVVAGTLLALRHPIDV